MKRPVRAADIEIYSRPHWHSESDELVYVLDGESALGAGMCDDDGNWFAAMRAGDKL